MADSSKQFNSYQIRRIAKVAAFSKRLQDMLIKIDPEGLSGTPASQMEDALQGFLDVANQVLCDAISQSKINQSKVF